MADYYPLIARAVGGLDKNTGDNRRALYDRARAALVAQLRSSTPSLEESEITRERLALEEAIRQVESDATRAPPPAAPPGEPEAPDAADGSQPSLRDEGLRNFREVMAEADDLGGAAAQANKSAREFYEQVPVDQPQRHDTPAEETPHSARHEQKWPISRPNRSGRSRRRGCRSRARSRAARVNRGRHRRRLLKKSRNAMPVRRARIAGLSGRSCCC